MALAYVDQLTRTRGIQPDRARAVKTALERADGLRGGSDRNAAAVVEQLEALAKQIDERRGPARPDATPRD